MRQPKVIQSNRVTAVFQDATMLAFDLRLDTTFGQLAERIGNLARLHGGLSCRYMCRLHPADPSLRAVERFRDHAALNCG